MRRSEVLLAYSEITGASDRNEACAEFRGVVVDVVPGLIRKLEPNDEYQLELLDAEQRTLLRIRIVSEITEP